MKFKLTCIYRAVSCAVKSTARERTLYRCDRAGEPCFKGSNAGSNIDLVEKAWNPILNNSGDAFANERGRVIDNQLGHLGNGFPDRPLDAFFQCVFRPLGA